MRSITLLLFLLSLTSLSVEAQVVNAGGTMHLSDSSLFFIGGNYQQDGGVISGNGTIEIKGNVTNNSTQSIFAANAGTTVVLSGNYQSINGNVTTLPNLTLSGNGDKTANTDLFIGGKLSLGDQLLHVGHNKLAILNPAVDAVERSSGFITTNDGGVLVRNTNSGSSYLFPLGSTKNNPAFSQYNSIDVNPLYRPVSFQPADAGANTFSATLNNADPDAQYSRSKRESGIETVSDKFYYQIEHNAGSSIFDASFYQVKAVDNNASIVTWSDTKSRWEKVLTKVNEGVNTDRLDRSLTFTPQGQASFVVSFAHIPFEFYNAFSPDGDGKNETWQIKNIDMYPDNTLSIFNRWGDEVYEIKGYSNSRAWDGGNLQPGTYFYVLKVNVAGETKTFKGFITMIKKN